MSDKRTYEKAVKKSVSMPEFLFDHATDRQRQFRLATFSDYIQELIRRDTESGRKEQLSA
jgi:hypothetical protein